MKYKLAVLGAGNMAEAITRGILRRKLIAPGSIIASDPSEGRRKLFTEELGVVTTDDNAAAASQAEMLLLATKPYQLDQVLGALANVLTEKTLIISIAAGISTERITSALGGSAHWRIVRAMPNTPMLVGQGASGLARGQWASADDLSAARAIFESAGVVVEVTEAQIDAVTAVSGSGPAYFFYLVEAMTRTGVELGLEESAARLLAIQTCLGAGELLSKSSDSAAELRKKVTTPGGTTHAAISFFESHDFPHLVAGALHAAAARSKELGK